MKRRGAVVGVGRELRAVVHDVVRRIGRSVGRRALARLARAVDPATVSSRLAAAAPDPAAAAAASADRLLALTPPTPVEVVANFLRGYVLLGGAPDAKMDFEWRPLHSGRAVITVETARVPRRLRGYQRRGEVEVRLDGNSLAEIMRGCRAGRPNSWVSDDLIELYRQLDELGLAAAVGAYRDGRLVGGLWGLTVGGVFSLMSMFHLEARAGALAMAALVDSLGGDRAAGSGRADAAAMPATDGPRWWLIDCGELNPNFERYGAVTVASEDFARLALSGIGARVERPAPPRSQP